MGAKIFIEKNRFSNEDLFFDCGFVERQKNAF